MQKKWIRIPMKIANDKDLSGTALRLFCLLEQERRKARRKEFEVPIVVLQQALGLCAWSVTRRIRELEAKGYLSVSRPRRGQLNKYRLAA